MDDAITRTRRVWLGEIGHKESQKRNVKDAGGNRIKSAGHATTAIGPAAGTPTTGRRGTGIAAANTEDTVTPSKGSAPSGGIDNRRIRIAHPPEQGDDFTILARFYVIIKIR